MEGWTWVFAPDPREVRRTDYSLSQEQLAIRETFSDFFTRESPSTVVRESEPLGFDSDLWERAAKLGLAAMRLPEDQGGVGASVVDLVLIAEEAGRAAAPVPVAETTVTVSLLALAGDEARLEAVGEGTYISTLALRPLSERSKQLLPAGAIADGVVALDGDELALYELQDKLPHVRNLGTAPLAWWTPSDSAKRTVLASGDDARALYEAAVAEWRLLTAAYLIGGATTSVRLAVEFAKTRLTSGVPIGALQGVSHPLVDAEILIRGARNMIWKAAWFHDNERGAFPELVAMAFAQADHTASAATATSLHMQGGLGFTLEGDVTLHLRRAKGTSVVGEPLAAVRDIGDAFANRTLRGGLRVPRPGALDTAGVFSHGL
jgi:alkylation response protein AidB-like acyl-CoA dehydrogenase